MKRSLLWFLLVSVALIRPAAAIETTAKQAYMIDTTTGTVLLDKSGSEQMHPSSMSKLMTLYIAFQQLKEGKIKLDDTFLVSEKSWKMQGSKTFLHVGDKVPVEVLLHGIITQSGNDACIALAEGIAGTEEAFAERMNKAGGEIGLDNSNFTNSTGWPDDNHLMSARDLAILSKHIIEEFPEYYPYFAVPEYTYNKIKQPNRNLLLGELGVDGLKTGHTEAGGYGIALSAKQKERRLILVINGLSGDKERVAEGRRLLQYGFSAFENKTILKAGTIAAEADVWFGQKPTVGLTSESDVIVTLPAAAQNELKFTLKYQGPLAAPVARGTHVGDLIIKSGDQTLQTVPLVTADDVNRLTGFRHAIGVIKHLIYTLTHRGQ